MKLDSGQKGRNILVIAHQFPPAGGIGVQRILRFCRDLPEYGWEPIVLTGKGDDYPMQDPSLLEKTNGIRFFRTDIPPFLKNLLPSGQIEGKLQVYKVE